MKPDNGEPVSKDCTPQGRSSASRVASSDSIEHDVTLDAPRDSIANDATLDARELTAAGQRLGSERVIGRLKVLRTVGAGNMGEVYAAYDPELDREVAVKLIRGNNSDAARTRLYREAQALAKLAHPNVVAVHDVGTHQGKVWVAMEFVVGRTLKQWVADEQPRWRQVLAVIKQAARGLAAAHAEGLLHRDVKPANIMVGDDGRVRVMDFGLARADERTDQNTRHNNLLSLEMTAAGALLGTPAYMAPEQFLGLPADERTDEFSLAVTLWEALFGRRPFAGNNFVELSSAVIAGNRLPFPTDTKIPGWLRKVLERALDIDRNKRFESVRAMLESIELSEQRARLRALVAGLASGLIVMALLGILAAIQWRTAETARALAKQNEGRALASETELKHMIAKLEQEKIENRRSLSVQRGLRAKMLIPEDREGEALKLGVLAVGAYGPDWTDAPPEATDALERVPGNRLRNHPARTHPQGP